MTRKPELGVKLRLGFIVFGGLVALEIVEYTLGIKVQSGNWPYLGILALLGAWPILQYFMHIRELRHPKE